ncbi:hypothetical protein OEA41_005576 [Lepraria neglecta]|uniref:PA14 domain-containing protein n=1 Tax=Lepraria neglecta TaxID=209136 RepID=A0AAE0DJV3_9LECA|nr:hypothetical protein OEA41_005576 [Lepraria neglecta]
MASLTEVVEIVEPVQVTSSTTITTGQSLYTTLLRTGIDEVVIPTAVTTTVVSGSSQTTVTITAANGQPTVEVLYAADYGMVYGAFYNPYNIYGSSSAAPFDVTCFDGVNPLLACEIALNINFAGDEGEFGYLPGQNELKYKATIAVVYQGYFIVPETGTYIFSTSSDDYGYVWAGDVAYKKWSDVNFVASSSNMSIPQQFNQGNFIPTTILYANSAALASSNFSLTFPNGTIVNDFTDLFLQPSPHDTWSPTPTTTCPLSVATPDCNFQVNRDPVHPFNAGYGVMDNPTYYNPPRTMVNTTYYPASTYVCTAAMFYFSSDRSFLELYYLLPRTSGNALCIRWPRILTVNTFNVPNSDVVGTTGKMTHVVLSSQV